MLKMKYVSITRNSIQRTSKPAQRDIKAFNMINWGHMNGSKSHSKMNDGNADFQLPKLPRVGKRVPSNLMVRLNPRAMHNSTDIGSNSNDLLEYTKSADNRFIIDKKSFQFDNILEEDSSTSVTTIVKDLIDGYNYNIMTYGQAKTGKTRFLFDEREGYAINLCKQLYAELTKIHGEKFNGSRFNINLSSFEIYAETVYDLLVPVTNRKPLKLSHQTENDNILDYNKNDYCIKNLKAMTIKDLDHLIQEITELTSTYHEARKSHVFIRLNIQQLDTDDDILKNNVLQIVDLKDVDSKSGVSHDDMKKISLGLDSFKLIVDKLSKQEKIHSHFKDSNFTRLLYSSFMHNYKNLFIICCSDLKNDKNKTLDAMEFASNLSKIETDVYRNHFGLNSKAKFDLYVNDIKIKEENYKQQIGFLKKRLQTVMEMQPKYDEFDKNLSQLKLENSKLKEQIKIVKSFNKKQKPVTAEEETDTNNEGQSKSDDASASVESEGNNTTDAMQIILEKCEEIAKMQLTLDNEKHINETYKQELEELKSREDSIQGMNNKLMDQVNTQTKALESVLSHNSILKNEVLTWSNIVENQKEKLQTLENRLKENDGSNHLAVPLEHPQSKDVNNNQPKMNSWSFSGSKTAFWKNTKPSAPAPNHVSQDPIVSAKTLPKTPSHVAEPRGMKRGLKLNSIRVVSNPPPGHDKEAKHEDNDR